MFFKSSLTHKSGNYTSLSKSEINTIQKKAKNSHANFTESLRSSGENMAGDLQSRRRGTGIDFEENKPYEPGSDSRNINWRTFARTQQLYVNIYNEDKRPSTYLLFDQRSNMYFGTRKQLKIKQALKFAIYALLHAMHQQQTVSGVQMANETTWHTTYSNSNSILSFIDTLNTPSTAEIENTSVPALNDILSKLKLTDGTELIIISDLHDMNEETVSSLYNLSQRYKITIIQIQDPIEINLPSKGIFNIQNDSDITPIEINCNNKSIIEAYYKKTNEYFANFKNKCTSMGISFQQYTTTDDVS